MTERRESRPVGCWTGEAAEFSAAGHAPENASSLVLLAPPTPEATCPTCRLRGLNFPAGHKRCLAHASVDDIRLLDELDGRAPSIGLPRDTRGRGLFRWPYGPNIDVAARIRMLDWATTHGLTYVDRAHTCLTWLRGGRCGRSCYEPRPAWLDHVTLWGREGAPAVLVAQPYHLDDRDGFQLGILDREPGLRLELRAEGSWYGFGTWFVGLWKEADA